MEDPLDAAFVANFEKETLTEEVHGAPLVVDAPAAEEEKEPVEDESGVPAGCTDYKVQGGKLVPSDQEENWRCSGSTVVRTGPLRLTGLSHCSLCSHFALTVLLHCFHFALTVLAQLSVLTLL